MFMRLRNCVASQLRFVALLICLFVLPQVYSADKVTVGEMVAAGMIAQPVVLNANGGWSWFEDERAIVDVAGGKILVSSVAVEAGTGGALRKGDIDIASFDIRTKTVQTFVLHKSLQADDHNSAALYQRTDGRYLAMYAKHGNDSSSRWRVSSHPHDLTHWEAEQTFSSRAGVTYSNLHYLANDKGGAGRLYNFNRSLNYDPNLLVSSDEGESWSYGGKLLSEGGGGDRPYLRYFSEGDKVHFIATERHPRQFDNSVYHGYLQDGQLFGSAGNLLDSNLFNSAAVAPNQLTPILTAGTVVHGAAMRRGWTIDASVDASGHPVALHQARANDNNLDHRFFYSRWDGSQWKSHFLGYAGSHLYSAESDYTGLVAIDPDDANTVYLSSEVHPATQAQLLGADGQRHYEIFRGVTSDHGSHWKWTPLTFNSTQDNLRPIVPKWDASNTAILWMRGNYTSYTNYDTEVVGLINPTIAELGAALSIDFGATGQLVQEGFQAFTREEGPSGAAQTHLFSSGNTAGLDTVGLGPISVTISSKAQFRNRGNDVASPIGDVADDFVFSPGALDLTLGNLREGDYQLVLYSHDRDFSQGGFSISQGNRQLGILRPTVGISPAIGVASSRVWFHADGSSDVELKLASLTSSSVLLNGFELYSTAAPVSPGKD